MLSKRCQLFLQKHKRRRHVTDMEFIERLFTNLGVSPVQHLLAFQDTFAGYVSPTRHGQCVWGLTTSCTPDVFEHNGRWMTSASDNTHRIDTQGCIYSAESDTPLASSAFMLFEQMACIYEWDDSHRGGSGLSRFVTSCRDVAVCKQTMIPQVEKYRVENLSDGLNQLFASESFIILDSDQHITVWFVRETLPSELLGFFNEPQPIENGHAARFGDHFRSLFCQHPRWTFD